MPIIVSISETPINHKNLLKYMLSYKRKHPTIAEKFHFLSLGKKLSRGNLPYGVSNFNEYVSEFHNYVFRAYDAVFSIIDSLINSGRSRGLAPVPSTPFESKLVDNFVPCPAIITQLIAVLK